MRFAPEYVAHVLSRNFDDAKTWLLEPLLGIHYAHLVMLVEQGIVPAAEGRRLREALDAIPVDAVRTASFDGSCEDLYFYVDRLVSDACGEDTAGRLHTARSRNDIDMTMYRMYQRGMIARLAGAVLGLRATLLDLADRHVDAVFAASTHTQPAQPTTIAHYLAAIVEQLERDDTRLAAACRSTNKCPLGACAITGTGFPIDRTLTSDLLGFDEPTGNTYGSIATVDYLLESMAAVGVLVVGLGRFVQDLLLWCTADAGYLRLGDGFVQCSSIMPQKRNPVALEHARALGSRAFARSQTVASMAHNTPFGDIVDTEDDMQPVVVGAFGDAEAMVAVVSAALGTAVFDVARLEGRAANGGTTLTELADSLVREHQLSFRTAHAVARKVGEVLAASPDAPASAALADASRTIAGRRLVHTEEEVQTMLSPRHFVTVRSTPGGPAPVEVGRAMAASRDRLAVDTERWSAVAARVERAAGRLRERAGRL